MSECKKLDDSCPSRLALRKSVWCVKRKLSTGSTSTVYVGTAPHHDDAAIKVFQGHLADQRLMYNREHRTASAIGCVPGFSCMLDYGTVECGDTTLHVIVYRKAKYDLLQWMSKVRGGAIEQNEQVPSPRRRSLTSYIQNLHRLPNASTIMYDFVKSIVRSLLWLRRHRLVHRDIKPQNILVYGTKTSPVFVFGDLGTVCSSNPARRFRKVSKCKTSESQFGTVDYVQWGRLRAEVQKFLAGRDGKYANRKEMYWADIFATGCVLYEFFTGMQVGNIDIKSRSPREYAKKHFPLKVKGNIVVSSDEGDYGIRASVLNKMVNTMLFSTSYRRATRFEKYWQKLFFSK